MLCSTWEVVKWKSHKYSGRALWDTSGLKDLWICKLFTSMISFYGTCLYQNLVFLHSDLTRGFLPTGIEGWHQSSAFKIQMEDVTYKNWHWVMRGKSPVTSIDPQSVTLSKSLNLLCLSLWCSNMISMCTLSARLLCKLFNECLQNDLRHLNGRGCVIALVYNCRGCREPVASHCLPPCWITHGQMSILVLGGKSSYPGAWVWILCISGQFVVPCVKLRGRSLLLSAKQIFLVLSFDLKILFKQRKIFQSQQQS